MDFLKTLLADLAKLRIPVTASAVVALFLALVEPFGLKVDPTVLTGAVVVVGAIASYAQSRLSHLLADLVTLRFPVTAAAVAATVVTLAQPFGWQPDPAVLAGVLVAVGVIAEYVSTRATTTTA